MIRTSRDVESGIRAEIHNWSTIHRILQIRESAQYIYHSIIFIAQYIYVEDVIYMSVFNLSRITANHNARIILR